MIPSVIPRARIACKHGMCDQYRPSFTGGGLEGTKVDFAGISQRGSIPVRSSPRAIVIPAVIPEKPGITNLFHRRSA